jgi:cytochrome c oxidase assembly factor CtaG
MTTIQFLTAAWKWNPALLLLCALTGVGYFLVFGRRGRPVYFAVALAIVLAALISPLSELADGYLFSAHMIQHILLVLIVPALLLSSLPRSFSLPRPIASLNHPLMGWIAGVGAMWLWHAPALCNAATTSSRVFAVQTTSLLLMGSAFWWQVLAPREQDRLPALAGIIYLFTACTACSVLGIILTFAPVSICPVYQQPVDRLGILDMLRSHWGLTSETDQKIGGLLMWVPMCLIYVAAILAQLARWQSDSVPRPEKSHA